MPHPVRVLLVAGSPDDARLTVAELRRVGFEPSVLHVQNDEAMATALLVGPWHVVVAHDTPDGFDAAAALRGLRISGADLPFIVVSAIGDVERAVELMRKGAQDYIPAGSLTRLGPALKRELRAKADERARFDAAGTDVWENPLGQSQKLEALGQFAAGIAHDLSGFATAINICTHLLNDLITPDAQVRQLLDEISKAANRSTSLTHQLLAFSRQQALAPKLVSLNDVIREAGDMLRRLLPERIQFVISLHPRAEPVRADPSQIERILFNLVVNARDAMPDGGTLRIETTSLNDDGLAPLDGEGSLPPGRYTMVAVSDSGVGISPEIHHRIFEPFFTTKQPGSASGVGLTVVRGIVKQCNGHISVDSRPGQGAHFKIYLPSAAVPLARSGE